MISEKLAPLSFEILNLVLSYSGLILYQLAAIEIGSNAIKYLSFSSRSNAGIIFVVKSPGLFDE